MSSDTRETIMDLARHLLFENPLTLWIVLGFVGAVSLGLWTRSHREAALWVTAACLILCLVIGILAWAVETDFEKVVRTLDTMGSAIESGNADKFCERISPAYQNGPNGKEELAGIVARALSRLRATPGDPLIKMGPTEATVTQNIRFDVSGSGGSSIPLPGGRLDVTWEGKFAPDPDGEWRLRSAIATKPVQITPEAAAKYLH
jgi:hypothetical protein